MAGEGTWPCDSTLQEFQLLKGAPAPWSKAQLETKQNRACARFSGDGKGQWLSTLSLFNKGQGLDA